MGRISKILRRLSGRIGALAPVVTAQARSGRGRTVLPWRELEHYPKPPATHPTRWQWPAYLDNKECRWLQSLRELYEMPIAFPDSISPEAGLLVHALVRNIQPRVVVEIGAFIGISAHWIAGALRECAGGESPGPCLHLFDLFDPIRKGAWRDAEMAGGRQGWIEDRLRSAGLTELVRMHPGDSGRTLEGAREELKSQGGVQLAFIDGDHTPAGVLRDFRAIEPVLNTGGYIVLHDTIPEQCSHSGPRRLLDTIHDVGAGRYERMDLYSAPLNYGLGLLRRIG